ncbi:DUF4134 domain-containing protein [Phocaeicola vulgatus]|jgi:hypothetical protein|nr:DUF4134 domain-containing protein [Phocaeicola vulgatus]UVO93262.1 DUF4134 domain-containing protein [Phocaeicola vulgatus]
MQIIKKSAQNLTERFIGSSFGQKCVVAAIALIISTSNAMAGSKGAAGFTKATQEVSSYQTPVSNLMKAIAAVIVLVGAFNVYFKMQNGDQDVKNILVLQNWLERIRKEVTNKVLSIKRISDFLIFPILAQPTLKKI